MLMPPRLAPSRSQGIDNQYWPIADKFGLEALNQICVIVLHRFNEPHHLMLQLVAFLAAEGERRLENGICRPGTAVKRFSSSARSIIVARRPQPRPARIGGFAHSSSAYYQRLA